MYQFRNNLKSARGLVVVRNILGLLFIWCLVSLILVNIDWYSRARELDKRQWVIYANLEHPIGNASLENQQINFISTHLVKLLNYPDVENIKAENEKALRYMTQDMEKRTRWYLEWRVDGIRRFREQNKNAVAYLLEDIDSEIVLEKNLPKIINKPLFKEGGRYALVNAKMKAFRLVDGKEIESKSMRELVHLLPVKPTIDKPSPWLVDAIVSLD